MMVNLGLFLISNGICTPLQIEEGLRNQNIFGGQLGTVLFELGYVKEETLSAYLKTKYNTPVLHGMDIECEPEAIQLISAKVANRLEIIPYRLKGRQLEVICMDPSNLHHLDEVAFITGARIKIVVVTEFRFWYLLQQYYNIRHKSRYIDLDSANSSTSSRTAAPSEKPLVTTTEDGQLVSELDFTRYYHQVDNYHEVTITPEDEDKPDEKIVPATDTTAANSKLPFLDEQFILALPPEPALSQSSSDSQPVDTDSIPISIETPTPTETVKHPDSSAEQIDEPINSFAEAQQQLDQASDRDTIAHTIMRFALSFFSRVMLFTVKRQMVSGWKGMGESTSSEQVRSLSIPLSDPSVFQMVTHNKAHYLGPIQKTPLNIEFLRATDKIVPLSAFVLPILLRGQVVNLLYADNGHKQHCNHNIGELLILAQRIGQSYEVLIQNNRTDFLKTTN